MLNNYLVMASGSEKRMKRANGYRWTEKPECCMNCKAFSIINEDAYCISQAKVTDVTTNGQKIIIVRVRNKCTCNSFKEKTS